MSLSRRCRSHFSMQMLVMMMLLLHMVMVMMMMMVMMLCMIIVVVMTTVVSSLFSFNYNTTSIYFHSTGIFLMGFVITYYYHDHLLKSLDFVGDGDGTELSPTLHRISLPRLPRLPRSPPVSARFLRWLAVAGKVAPLRRSSHPEWFWPGAPAHTEAPLGGHVEND